MASFSPGLRLGQVVRPLDTVAAYIPAGRYPLPSTVIMTAVPALVAGVKTVCAACPKAVDEVFGTAHILGVENVFQMGGAQAIAAFAYGTKTVPRADRIVGPGNIYVAAAKKLLAGEVGIDFVAGPTEILIIAAEGDARFLAADMLAQAEHDTDASAILLTTSKKLAAQVAKEVERQLSTLPTAPVARKAIDKNSAIIIVRSLDEAAELSNSFAPEHLAIHHEEPDPEDSPRRQYLRRPIQPRSRRRLRLGPEPRAAYRRRGQIARWIVGGGLCEGHLGTASERTGAGKAGPIPSRHWLARKGWKRTPDRSRCGLASLTNLPSRGGPAPTFRRGRMLKLRAAVLVGMAPYSPRREIASTLGRCASTSTQEHGRLFPGE